MQSGVPGAQPTGPQPFGPPPVQFANDVQQVLPPQNAAGVVGNNGIVAGFGADGGAVPQTHLVGINVYDRVDFVKRPLVSEGPEALRANMTPVVHAIIRINPQNTIEEPVENLDGSPLRETLQRLQIEPHYEAYKNGARPMQIRTPLLYIGIEEDDRARLAQMGIYDVEGLAGAAEQELQDRFDRPKVTLFKHRATDYLEAVHTEKNAGELQAQVERLTKERDSLLTKLKDQARSHREFELNTQTRLAALEEQGLRALQEGRAQATAAATAAATDPGAPDAIPPAPPPAAGEDPAPTPVG